METEVLTTERAFRAQIALCSVALPVALHGLGKHQEATRLETLARALRAARAWSCSSSSCRRPSSFATR